MRKLYYMGLEPYKARYTLQLQDWNTAAFDARGLDYVVVPGETLSNDQAIVTGQVLDAHKGDMSLTYNRRRPSRTGKRKRLFLRRTRKMRKPYRD